MRFKTLLISLAGKSTHPRYRHAAVVAKGKRILGTGHNSYMVHAEAEALLNAGERAKGATLYTLMLKRSGDLGNGAPCPECMALLQHYQVRKVVLYI